MKAKRIVLASTSPRRSDLMTKHGLNYEIIPSDYEEPKPTNQLPSKYAETQATQKSIRVAQTIKNAIVIGADTVVALDRKILGKPHTKQKACKMLRFLSGKQHKVITGYCITDTESKKVIIGHTIGLVTIRDLTDYEITRYVDTHIPLDKAGAYAIQEDPLQIVANSEGDIEAIVGLPISVIVPVLNRLQAN